MIVGLTYYTHDEIQIEMKQFWGIIKDANAACIQLLKSDGSILELPPALDAFQYASPGEYTLRSTQEVVSNPDFTVCWSIFAPASDT